MHTEVPLLLTALYYQVWSAAIASRQVAAAAEPNQRTSPCTVERISFQTDLLRLIKGVNEQRNVFNLRARLLTALYCEGDAVHRAAVGASVVRGSDGDRAVPVGSAAVVETEEDLPRSLHGGAAVDAAIRPQKVFFQPLVRNRNLPPPFTFDSRTLICLLLLLLYSLKNRSPVIRVICPSSQNTPGNSLQMWMS